MEGRLQSMGDKGLMLQGQVVPSVMHWCIQRASSCTIVRRVELDWVSRSTKGQG